MTPFEFCDIVLVPFPFTDQTTTKKRPAVVICSKPYIQERPDLIIMAVTSQMKPTSLVGEVIIQGWQAIGHQTCYHHHREVPDHPNLGEIKRLRSQCVARKFKSHFGAIESSDPH